MYMLITLIRLLHMVDMYYHDVQILFLNLQNLVWFKVNVTNARGRHDLLDLQPFTEYEFQISSKLHLFKGSWSDWSQSQTAHTPEEGMFSREKEGEEENMGRGGVMIPLEWNLWGTCIESESMIALINKSILTLA